MGKGFEEFKRISKLANKQETLKATEVNLMSGFRLKVPISDKWTLFSEGRFCIDLETIDNKNFYKGLFFSNQDIILDPDSYEEIEHTKASLQHEAACLKLLQKLGRIGYNPMKEEPFNFLFDDKWLGTIELISNSWFYLHQIASGIWEYLKASYPEFEFASPDEAIANFVRFCEKSAYELYAGLSFPDSRTLKKRDILARRRAVRSFLLGHLEDTSDTRKAQKRIIAIEEIQKNAISGPILLAAAYARNQGVEGLSTQEIRAINNAVTDYTNVYLLDEINNIARRQLVVREADGWKSRTKQGHELPIT